jgi:hypothetical protein
VAFELHDERRDQSSSAEREDDDAADEVRSSFRFDSEEVNSGCIDRECASSPQLDHETTCDRGDRDVISAALKQPLLRKAIHETVHAD